MNIPVLLEPTPTGFRASTGAPLNLVAEAATEEQALKAVRLQLAAKLAAGARVTEVDVPTISRLQQLVQQMAEFSDVLDEVNAIVKENRRREAEEDAAAELAAEEAKRKSSSAQEPAA